MRILVADDDKTNRSLITGLLNKLGHEVVECSDGKAVLGHLFKGDLPQLIFLDWMMPEVDGIETLTKIRERQELPYTHIIMVTAKTDPSEIIEGLRAGASDYITKPYNLQELESRLRIGVQLVELNQLVNKQRLQIIASSKMAILGEMASNIAHEINNPLTIINGHIERLHDRLNPTKEPRTILPPSEITKSYDVILETTKRIHKIIKSLKDFASDGENEPFEWVKVHEVIENALSLCSSKLKNHHVKITVSPIPNMFMFEVQSVQICQILVNLIANSYLAIQDKADRWIKIDAAEDSENLMISVTDSGNGIPEHIRSKIMQPFYTTRPFGKGTGLGLSISKGIAEFHGGTLTIDETSLNTRFVLSIPIKRKPKTNEQ